jgi:type IV pilus assembly protein PilC
MQLSFPIARSVFPKIVTARFSRSLAILLKSGVNLLTALELMDRLIGNVQVEERFVKVRKDIGEGENLVPALAKIQVFPPLFLRLIGIGQKTGFLDEMLIKAAGIFDEEVDESLVRMTNLLEPIIIIVLSIVVGIILLSVMLPMISIMNAIG